MLYGGDARCRLPAEQSMGGRAELIDRWLKIRWNGKGSQGKTGQARWDSCLPLRSFSSESFDNSPTSFTLR